MWTSRNRARYDRSKLRYPSDVTDEEWELIVPLIPPGKSGGGKRTVIMREVVNGLMYVISTGCQWRAIPNDLPPKSTVYEYFDLWTDDGTLQRIHHALYEQCREQAQREASPTAAIIDSQSVKSAEKDAMGRAARTMAPSSLQRINGAPHATAERFEQIPRNSQTRCNTDRRDRDGPVELAGRWYRAWRRALAVVEARGR
jgi:transposase